MAKRKSNSKKSIFIILLLLIVVGVGIAYQKGLFNIDKIKSVFNKKEVSVSEDLEVHFIDVGQGDCSLIVSGDTAILIDTGEKENGETICEYIEKLGIPDIDCMLLTHPHSDHMGAASYVIDNMEIKQIIIPKVTDDMTPTTKFYEKFLKSVQQKGLKITVAQPGLTVPVGEGELEILSPVKDYSDLNNYSAAAELTYGGEKFLFTGDIEKKAEKDIIKEGGFEDIDVLKVAHHGSNSSSCKDFLEIVKPEYAVIMCDGVSYNHPHEEAVERITEYTDKIYRTDMDGNVVFRVDKEGLSVETQK